MSDRVGGHSTTKGKNRLLYPALGVVLLGAVVVISLWAISRPVREPTCKLQAGRYEVPDEPPYLTLCPEYTRQVLDEWEIIPVPLVDTLDQPIAIAHAADGSDRLFILERAGRIRIVDQGTLLAQSFLDIRDRVTGEGLEQGLLGLAFDPRYRRSGFFYVYYTDRDGDVVLARYAVTADANRAARGSETIVLKIPQPTPLHNGGQIAFGPDGFLYVGVGDGGETNDPQRTAQNPNSLHGTILRIDVRDLPYSIPPSNPFAADPAARGEIWAMGLRNPWRFSFDRATGDLYLPDVGEGGYEELNLVPSRDATPRNFGWPLMEGFECFSETPCGQGRFNSPLAVYPHSTSCAIVGGIVYRGSRYPTLVGTYLFSDYCSGRIWGLTPLGNHVWQVRFNELGIQGVASLGEDEAGEVYVAGMLTGTVYRLDMPTP